MGRMGLRSIEDMLQVMLQNDYFNQTEMMGVNVAVARPFTPPLPSSPRSPHSQTRKERIPHIITQLKTK